MPRVLIDALPCEILGSLASPALFFNYSRGKFAVTLADHSGGSTSPSASRRINSSTSESFILPLEFTGFEIHHHWRSCESRVNSKHSDLVVSVTQNLDKSCESCLASRVRGPSGPRYFVIII